MHARAKPSEKEKHLVIVRSLAYKDGSYRNKQLMSTFDFVADEFPDEAIKTTPHMAPEDIVQKILGRRFNIQYNLDHTNMKEMCNTQATEMAKAHYEKFNLYKRSEIRKFIKEQTKE